MFEKAHNTIPLLLLACLAAGLTLAASPAGAQTLERLESQLQRTDDALAEAAEVVVGSESERARTLLLNANQLQRTAWEFFDDCGGTRLSACRSAAEATVRARREALHAVQVAREQSSEERLAQQSIERAQQMLEQAIGVVREQGTDDARTMRLLEQARTQLGRAMEQYRERQFSIAVRLASTSMALTRQALQLEVGGGMLDAERVERQLGRTQRLIERSRVLVEDTDDEQARTWLEQAVAQQAKAREQFADGRLVVALALTKQARQLAQRALGLVADGPVDAEAVTAAVEKTDAMIDRVAPVVRESGAAAAVQLLERAVERQAAAKQQLADGALKRALVQTRVARNLAGEALAIARR